MPRFPNRADVARDESPASSPVTPSTLRQEGNQLLGAGAVLGSAGLASGLFLGAVCPVCVVVTPALLGIGTYKHWCARRAAKGAPRTPRSRGDR